MTPTLEGLPTKAKEAPSPHHVRLARWTPVQYFNVSVEVSMSWGKFNTIRSSILREFRDLLLESKQPINI